jgi:hypothetical protein
MPVVNANAWFLRDGLRLSDPSPAVKPFLTSFQPREFPPRMRLDDQHAFLRQERARIGPLTRLSTR